MNLSFTKKTKTAIVPNYATDGAAGLDLCADTAQPIIIHPGERRLISTGIAIQLPDGFEAQVRPRSGMALKHGITVLNSPGTIDPDYTGDVGVILYNASDRAFEVRHGDRIAQLVIAPFVRVALQEVESLDETARGDQGFGHTGVAA